MIKKETRYYRGCEEVSKETYERTFDSSSRTITTKTDSWGRQSVTEEDCLGKRTYSDRGFSGEGYSDGAKAFGGVLVAAVIPLIIAGGVVYGAGKLIYHVATIEKRRREEEEHRVWAIKHYRESFEAEVNKILAKYNNRLEQYKDLYDLGILTEEEYNTHVSEYVRLSNEEIDKEKQFLARMLEMYDKR